MWATLSDHLEVVYGAVAALVIVIALTPAVGGFARRVGAVDVPGVDRAASTCCPSRGSAGSRSSSRSSSRRSRSST